MNDPQRCFLLPVANQRRIEYDGLRFASLGEADESFISFFHQNDSVCVASNYTRGKVSWSSAVPGCVRSVALSNNNERAAVCLADRCYVSSISAGLSLDFFPLPQTTSLSQASCVGFSPNSSNLLALTTARDIRVVDLNRALSRPEIVKSLFTISGAAAQAVPVSFSYIDSNVILTAWDLAASPYLRLVDLREGSSKSVKIWKSKSTRGLIASPLEPHLVASHGGNQTVVWDIRRGEAVHSLDAGSVHSLDWSPSKRNTLGVLSETRLAVHRLDLHKSYTVSTGETKAGAFRFSYSNDLVIVDRASGAVRVCPTKKEPIPISRLGNLFSVSSTGYSRMDSSGCSSLFAEVEALAGRMTDDTSLVESVASEEIDFVLPQHVHLETVAEPLSVLFAADEILSSSPGGLGLPLFQSPARTAAIDLLLSASERDLLLPLIQGDWASVLRSLAEVEGSQNFSLLQSVSSLLLPEMGAGAYSQLLLPGRGQSAYSQLRNEDAALGEAVDFANAVLGEPEHLRLVRVRDFITDRTDVGLFLRAAIAVSYLPTKEEVGAMLSLLREEPGTPSLRRLVLTGFNDSTAVEAVLGAYLASPGGSVLNVALLGLLLAGPRVKSLQPIFGKSAAFIRDEICNRLGGDCWRLRSVIDSLLSEAGPGSARLVCYYCNKPVVGGAAGGGGGGGGGSRCPQRGCHKPLPSCSVCLEPLRLTSEPADWSVWCSTCRHGGHNQHVRDWFMSFDECPVAGCACQCAAIDGA